MSRDTTKTIGPYEIVREIGRGGMGVVYLARDTRLDRDVAIKALPDDVGLDEERLTRFEREAKLLASLNHPNIATVHGLEEADGHRYLILEYVEGETLAEMLERGPLSVAEALATARQIAEAMEAAHDRGIVHRDLKPANVKFTADDKVKVLDFGLAKVYDDGAGSGTGILDSPTVVPSASATIAGVVMGTAGYLSPEQARGRSVDKRSDIWSFGCVLYEMLTGRTIFPGETATDSIGATLHKEPEWGALPPETPPVIQLLLRRCLTKDRRRRLHDIADARLEIDEAITDPGATSLNLAGAALEATTQAGRRRQGRRHVTLAAVLVGGLALGATLTFAAVTMLRPAPDRALERLSIVLPQRTSQLTVVPAFNVSRDGRQIVYGADGEEGGPQLFVRPINQRDPIPLPGTRDSFKARFSPGGEWIAFYGEDAIRRISVRGGPFTTLHEVSRVTGLAWSDDGYIYYTTWDTGLHRIGENGGTPEDLVSEDGVNFRGVEAITGTGAVLYASSPGFRARISIGVYDPASGTTRTLFAGSSPVYTASGHLVFMRDETLMAVPFDRRSLEVTGQPVPVEENVRTAFGYGWATVSATGVLYHLSGGLQEPKRAMQSIGPGGELTKLSDRTAFLDDPQVSPDGSRVALEILPEYGDDNDGSSIWMFDIERDQLTLLSTEPGSQMNPVWSADGQWVYYCANAETGGDFLGLFRRRADGGGTPELVFHPDERCWIQGVSPDGSRIVVFSFRTETRGDLDLIRLDGEPIREPWLSTAAGENHARISPDGRWVAYRSNESGNAEVYVRPLEGDGARWPVSRDGGDRPFWAKDGRTLYFLAAEKPGTHDLMSAEVTGGHDGDSFRTAVPTELARVPGGADLDLDTFPGGEGFIVVAPVESQQDDPLEISVTRNFFAELERVAPTP